MEPCCFYKKDNHLTTQKNSSQFWGDISKAEIFFFSWNVSANFSRIPAGAHDLFIRFFLFLFFFGNWTQHSQGEQKVAVFLLSCDIFHLFIFNSLLRFRAALSWWVGCFLVVNDHFFAYQKGRDTFHEVESPMWGTNCHWQFNSKRRLKFDKVPYGYLLM